MCLHACACACMREYVCVYARACVCTCVCICMNTCVCVCVFFFLSFNGSMNNLAGITFVSPCASVTTRKATHGCVRRMHHHHLFSRRCHTTKETYGHGVWVCIHGLRPAPEGTRDRYILDQAVPHRHTAHVSRSGGVEVDPPVYGVCTVCSQ